VQLINKVSCGETNRNFEFLFLEIPACIDISNPKDSY